MEKLLKHISILAILAVSLGSLGVPASPGFAQCRLCGSDSGSSGLSVARSGLDEVPLQIEITTNLNFSRLALVSRTGGEAHIDAVSGAKRVSGALSDLGGVSLNGQGRLKGEPGRFVRVQLPERILLSAPNGSTAELAKLETDLPVQVRLDQNGRLDFSFGGRLRVRGNASGQFRGRIAITAEYE